MWKWFDEAAQVAGLWREPVRADWTPPPMPMIEPAQEGRALQGLVRGGFMTLAEAIRERGGDPATHLQEYADTNKRLDELGIKLDSDPRATSAAGLTQERVGLAGPPKDEET